MSGRVIHSSLGREISEKYAGLAVLDLRKEIRRRDIKCRYDEFNYAKRDRLILALELGRCPCEKGESS